jgi:hypothetical protein
MKCKSGKHEWTRKEDAEKCCNGYERLVGVGLRNGKSYFQHYWSKIEEKNKDCKTKEE